jgi:ribosomal protein L4
MHLILAYLLASASERRFARRNPLGRTQAAGSGRALRPQKGSGLARLGDRGSPGIRGGGRAFGSGGAIAPRQLKANAKAARGAWAQWQAFLAANPERAPRTLLGAPNGAGLKTRELERWLAAQGAIDGLLVVPMGLEPLWLAARNLAAFDVVLGEPSLAQAMKAQRSWVLA